VDMLRCTYHHSKRLLIPAFPLPQSLHDAIIARVAEQLITAEALDSDDLTSGNRGSNVFELMTEPRTTCRARNCFRMKPAARRIGIFGRAGSAHIECLHRGTATVVGKPFSDGVARSAMRAAYEGI